MTLRAAVALIAATVSLVLTPVASALGLALAATPVVLSNFQPNATATGTGTLTVTTVLGSWTVSAQDTGTGAGHMVAGALLCTGSDSQLANPLTMSIPAGASGATSDGTITLSGTNQALLSGSGLLTLWPFTVNFSQVIPATETLLAGCAYSLTVTYTLQ